MMDFGEIILNDKKALNPTNRELGSAAPLKDLFARTAGFATMPFGGISQLAIDATPSEASIHLFPSMPAFKQAAKEGRIVKNIDGSDIAEFSTYNVSPNYGKLFNGSYRLADVLGNQAGKLSKSIGDDIMDVKIEPFYSGETSLGRTVNNNGNVSIGLNLKLLDMLKDPKLSNADKSPVRDAFFHELNHANDIINNKNRLPAIGYNEIKNAVGNFYRGSSEAEIEHIAYAYYLNQAEEVAARSAGLRSLMPEKFTDPRSPYYNTRMAGEHFNANANTF